MWAQCLMQFYVSCDLSVILYLTLFSTTYCGDVKPKQELYVPDYSIYHNLSRIDSHLREIIDRNPGYLKLDSVSSSRENRPQFLIRMTNFTGSRASGIRDAHIPKVKILLSFGEHAREFLPVESLFHLLLNITQGLSAPRESFAEKFSRQILQKIDLFIVSMVNPDGRHYVEQTQNYCWRGTSTGVDLNRNFDWSFGGKGSSWKKDDEEYRGTHAFSEPESLILKDLSTRYQFDLFVSFHSGIRQIYVPYADTYSKLSKRRPQNANSMLKLAALMSQATKYMYKYGLAYDLNSYTADGTVFDYMAGVQKIPFSYAIELWGIGDYKGAKCFDLFNPRSQDLQTALEEIHPLYETMFSYMIDWKHQQHHALIDPENDPPSLTFGFILLVVVILLTCVVAVHSRLPACVRIFPRRRIISLKTLSSTFSLMCAFR